VQFCRHHESRHEILRQHDVSKIENTCITRIGWSRCVFEFDTKQISQRGVDPLRPKWLGYEFIAARPQIYLALMLQGGGAFGGVRLLGRKTVEFMTADHLGSIPGIEVMTGPGFGFGLGVAVRLADGLAASPGSAGQYYWGGIAGTVFWVDPREELVAVLLTQTPGQREYYRALFRNLVYAALAE